MKQLMLMRHAKSSWKDPTLADHDRPLNRRGLRDAPRMGQFAARQEFLPELILSSTAVRARTTAELFLEGAEAEIPLVLEVSLYHAGPGDFHDALTNLTNGEHRVMIVSHNPGSEEWLMNLTHSYHRMPTAAIAAVEFDSDLGWPELNESSRAKLVDIWRPKEVF